MNTSRSKSSVPAGTLHAAQEFQTRRVYGTWADDGNGIDLPLIPVHFITRKYGGWWLVVACCPFCGQEHLHGSNLDADWNALDNGNPLVYSEAPKLSHCRNSKQEVYVHQITSGLPAEALESETAR